MNKILLSLGLIGVVAAVAVGATVAYFSDTETSVGNTFTAGTLDLKINGSDLTSPATLVTVSNAKPGDTGTDQGTLKNDGNINGKVSLAITITENDENGCNGPENGANGENGSCVTSDTAKTAGELCQNTNVWIKVSDTPVTDWSTVTTKVVNNNIVALSGISSLLGDLNAGATKYFQVGYEIPTTVNNSIQSDICKFNISAVLNQ